MDDNNKELNNVMWGKELDEYLNYIDEQYSDNPQPASETYDNEETPANLNMDLYDDLEYLEPFVDTHSYGKSVKKVRTKNRRANSNKHHTMPMVLILVILLLVFAGGYAIVHLKNSLSSQTVADNQFDENDNPSDATSKTKDTEDTTTEEATTEDPYGPYATRDYVVHAPHTTVNTILFDSNPYSVRYGDTPATTETGTANDGEEATTEEPTLEDLYPAITLSPVEGSLNATNPDPSNPAETQQMTSRYMVLIDLSDDSIVAKRDSDFIVNPASMTKILTVLTASDMIEDLDDTYVITAEDIQYAYANDCSAVGFLEGETVTVKDLIYGTIVCSGADAAVGLANYCCGSQDAFVEKMNQKVADLGLSETAHFTNVVGIYNEDLHCTMEDMAVILATAIQNDLCKEVLNTRIYTTTPDPSFIPDTYKEKHPELFKTNEQQTESSTDQATAGSTDGQADVSTDNPSDSSANEQTAADSSTDTPSEDATTEEEIPDNILLVGTTGIQISNWFMRRIEDKATGGEVLGAKTGYVGAAGFCCASYYKSDSGKEYICVTGDTYSSWRCIYDHVGIYRSLAR